LGDFACKIDGYITCIEVDTAAFDDMRKIIQDRTKGPVSPLMMLLQADLAHTLLSFAVCLSDS